MSCSFWSPLQGWKDFEARHFNSMLNSTFLALQIPRAYSATELKKNHMLTSQAAAAVGQAGATLIFI